MLRRGLPYLPVVAMLILAAMVGFVREFSGDFHWHVVLGEQILDERAIVDVDTFSHTFRGQPLLVTAWFGDVLLALAFQIGGYAGCYALRALCLVAAFGMLSREMIARGLRPATASAILVAILGLVMFQFYLKPEMFALLAFAVVVHALGAHERTARRRWLGVALGAILFWANTHGSVSLGLLAIGLYAVASAGRRWLAGERDLRRLAWWAALPTAALLVAMLNPSGPALFLSFQTITPRFAARTFEWQPLARGGLATGWILAGLAVGATTVLAGRRTSPWLVPLVVILAVLGWEHRRIATYGLFAAAPLLATNLGALRARLDGLGVWRRWRGLMAALVVVTALGAAAQLFAVRGLAREVGLGVDRHAYPIAACAWARAQAPAGNLFNNYDLGSYLMFCLGPRHPVFIDQRAMSLYTEAFYLRYLAAGEQPGVLEETVRAHHIAWAFVTYDPLASRMAADRTHWRLIYFDDQALIYVRLDDGDDHNRALAAAGFRYLEPARLVGLASLEGDALAEADRELAVQRTRAPDAARTRYAEAALAVAHRDDAAFAAVMGRLAPIRVPTLAYLVGLHATNHGDHAVAAQYFASIRRLGGHPVFSLLQEAQALGRAGERAAALERLEAARALGATPEAIADAQRAIGP